MPHHIMGKVMSTALENGSDVSKSGLTVSCPLAIFSRLTFMVSSSLGILVLQLSSISPVQIVNRYTSSMVGTITNSGSLESICTLSL